VSSHAPSIPGLPPLHRIGGVGEATYADSTLTLRAPARTDWFIDPVDGAATHDAPALVLAAQGDVQLSAYVDVEHRATFDAGVLVVHVDDRRWAKLCIERSPQGRPTIVSVVTREWSDDCNSTVLGQPSAHLRVSRLGDAWAFHTSVDGRGWDLVRLFGLGPAPAASVGFLSQSPTGAGCVSTFRGIALRAQRLGDLRSGV
jgi:regulation of enolase protein 1 (concanavalin A-like superfamily)